MREVPVNGTHAEIVEGGRIFPMQQSTLQLSKFASQRKKKSYHTEM